jgi:cation diffusion facilitator CzcD-associated flavoprotein CzcO
MMTSLTPSAEIGQSLAADACGLPALEARLHEDLSRLTLPAQHWVVPREHDGQAVLDVAVIGGGMAGLAAATSIHHSGMRATVFDRAPEGFEGPWATTARMETLRSPKQLTGPALGLPSLTFRAWYESQFGMAAWQALDKIPRLQWMDYLRWYRRVMAVDISNEHTVEAIVPRDDGLVALTIRAPLAADGDTAAATSDTFTVYARHVVLATGRDGLGGPALPPFIAGLPRDKWAHSSDDMDYRTLRGKRVAVVGAGASTMDSAATALEAGAASVDILIRRADFQRINKSKGAGNPGLTHGHRTLPDDWKWKIRHYINATRPPPPRGSTMRVSRHPNAYFNFNCPIRSVRVDADDTLAIDTAQGRFTVDFLIVATGFQVDWASRPEFAAFAPHIKMWRDRFQPEEGDADGDLASSPDLGDGFEFLEKTPGACPGLSRIHCFCSPAMLSHGAVSGDIPAISAGAQRLSRALAATIYGEDIPAYYAAMQAYDDPELLGDEWVPATGRGTDIA